MSLSVGTYLKSTSALNETLFENTIIYICEYNDRGAFGFIVNNIYHRMLNELEEFKQVPAFPLYNGGPVDQEHLFFIHTRPDIISGGTRINANVYYGGNFKDVTDALMQQKITENELKIFIGYCGWNSGELEAEILEESWQVIERENVFLI